MSKPNRNSSAYLQVTIFIGEEADTRDAVRVTNLTEGEARAIRDLWIEKPDVPYQTIRALAPKAGVEWVR